MSRLRESLRASKQNMQQLWEDKYRSQTGLTTSKPISNQGTSAFNNFTYWIQQQINREQADELSIYLNESCLRIDNPDDFRSLDWWLEASQKARYSDLWKMAVDVLSIPAMAASTERLFSECKASCERNRTSTDTLKEIHLLRSWQRSTILGQGLQVNLLPVWQSVLTAFRRMRRYSPESPKSSIPMTTTSASKVRIRAWVTC